MKIQRILIGALCALALSGCTRAVEQMKSATWAEVVGTLGGAALGGAAGAQFGGGLGQTIFMATGALVGGGVGYSAARTLGPMDLAIYEKTAQKAFASAPNGEVHSWSNPETGRSGIFRTVASYQRPDGSQCRQYRSSVVFDDGVASAGGSACQQSNGTWLAYNDVFK